MFTIENAQLVLKDKNGNVARIQNLGPDDLVKIHNAKRNEVIAMLEDNGYVINEDGTVTKAG